MIGRTLSHYRLVDELGRGGMGVVYRALDVTLDREVACKVLLPECVADPERRRRFFQEARAAAKLQQPYIGVVSEVDEAEGVTFIAMELIRGERLREQVGRGPLPGDDLAAHVRGAGIPLLSAFREGRQPREASRRSGVRSVHAGSEGGVGAPKGARSSQAMPPSCFRRRTLR